MVSKKKIGQIQLIIGIIIFLVGILGIYSFFKMGGVFFGDLNSYGAPSQFVPRSTFDEIKNLNISQETESILSINFLQLEISYVSIKSSFVLSTSIVLIALSLIFITQGLLNKSGEKNGH